MHLSFSEMVHAVSNHWGEGKPGGFETGGFPTFFRKGPDCVADPLGNVYS